MWSRRRRHGAEGGEGAHVLGVPEHLVVVAGGHVLSVAQGQDQYLVPCLVVRQVQ
ncbi:hypothetical protein PXH67_40490 (plasmid) [Streptomyces sp. P8-A8]|uniref:hypothetical protein n=1 Tax=Streptomyces sp. P8-A8 TaxID=3029759 RepID=UPI0036D99A18